MMNDIGCNGCKYYGTNLNEKPCCDCDVEYSKFVSRCKVEDVYSPTEYDLQGICPHCGDVVMQFTNKKLLWKLRSKIRLE